MSVLTRLFTKDHGVVKFLKSAEGRHAIAFGAKPNFSEHNILKVENFSSGVSVGLVYDTRNADHPIVELAKKYAASQEWQEAVGKTSMLPVKQGK